MKKVHQKYVCQSCGYESPRWTGKCPNCQGWNSFAEELAPAGRHPRREAPQGSAAVPITDVTSVPHARVSTRIPEFDRVLGGGVVPGSVVLVGGDPGIGKSTLMLQTASLVREGPVLYVSGEESASQIRLRAERLGLGITDSLLILAETDCDLVDAVIRRIRPVVVIVDSIQTMYRSGLESAPGTVSQVREIAAMMMRTAKTDGPAVFLVGHVTKEGVIAGPKVVEHIVDTVLQFEGERHYAFRVLRSMKNRFGSTNEIGIFEMGQNGLREVTNPSETFLAQRMTGASGSAVVASLEGTRPLLLEVQALVAPTSYGVPQRTATGFDAKRLQMLLAVLERRAGLHVGQYDVFVNIAGGVRAEEPAVDLGVAVSIVSSLKDVAVDPEMVVIGEVGLGGEIRGTGQIDRRIQEAGKLGFTKVVLPAGSMKNISQNGGPSLIGVRTIDEAIGRVLHGS